MTNSSLVTNLANRQWLIRRLRAEVIGPDPVGAPIIDPTCAGLCMTWEQWRQPVTSVDGEEVVWQDPPTKRYGAGILFPQGCVVPNQSEENSDIGAVETTEFGGSGLSDKDLKQAERISKNADVFGDSSEESEVKSSDEFLPRAMSISFLADLDLVGPTIGVELGTFNRLSANDDSVMSTPMGVYETLDVEIYNENTKKITERKIFIRKPVVTEQGDLPVVEIKTSDAMRHRVHSVQVELVENLRLQVVSRKWRASPGQRLITISLINDRKGAKDTASIFQAGMRVFSGDSTDWILPYPEYSDSQQKTADIDTKILRLNYRNHRAFSVGHGVATDWPSEARHFAGTVWTDSMPLYEMPSTTPELKFENDEGVLETLKISMRKLSGLDGLNGQFDELHLLLKEYDKWIAKSRMTALDEALDAEATQEVLTRIEHARQRIHKGTELLLSGDPRVTKAFELANLAMLIAQSRPKGDRTPSWEGSSSNYYFSERYAAVDLESIPTGRGFWRPFQIAFLIMSLDGLVDDLSPSREEVDLIWFPTGGGKTEAYLGVIAFLLFYRRLIGKSDEGVSVLMRYTLRLLTAQQFERATTLFCAMEFIRRQQVELLGKQRFSIGLWVGLAASPNKRDEAVKQLGRMMEDPDSAENPFILRRCPWCAAKFGSFRTEKAGNYVLGYVSEGGTVKFRCPDSECDFGVGDDDPLAPRLNDPLPVSVIDEDLIDRPPNLLVATVDKFAILAWKPEIRSFFGINSLGERVGDPPSLIIQDELHLISGPLGTIVGAYETVVDELCSQFGVRPKIVASTATISNAHEQIRNLYAREKCSIFPPTGLDANESFFAKESREDDGSQSPGRIYVGVMAPAYISLQTTQARVFASLMQWPAVPEWSDEERDPWWTLLCFFNSLRELGSAATLLLADTRDYLRVIASRHNHSLDSQFRKSLFPTELTSRIASHQIPETLNRLETRYKTPSGKRDFSEVAVDACLASNIIEVGVDVPRLSLMTVVGQPKTTAQYIQVSSRIGRDLTRPGMVFTLYSASKARDISHFEKFKNYHQKIYSHVEPTSVTPFSIPAVGRTLHALLVSLIRQTGELDTIAKDPTEFIPDDLIQTAREMIRTRVQIVSPDDESYVLRELESRLKEWKAWVPDGYGAFQGLSEDPSLMYQAGQSPPETWENTSWSTLTSMRGVDGSAEAKVTAFFNRVVDDGNADENEEEQV